MAKRRTAPQTSDKPFLRAARVEPGAADLTCFPFTIPAFNRGIDITFDSKVTLFVGENGSGKSTLLEALAACCGFNPEGGNRNHQYPLQTSAPILARSLRLSWSPKVTSGFFLRAESFFYSNPRRITPGGLAFWRVAHEQTLKRDQYLALFVRVFQCPSVASVAGLLAV